MWRFTFTVARSTAILSSWEPEKLLLWGARYFHVRGSSLEVMWHIYNMSCILWRSTCSFPQVQVVISESPLLSCFKRPIGQVEPFCQLAGCGRCSCQSAVKFYHPPTNIDPAREGKWAILRVHLPQPAEKWPVMSSTLSLLSIGEVPCCCLTLSYCIFCSQPGLRIINIDPYLLVHPTQRVGRKNLVLKLS